MNRIDKLELWRELDATDEAFIRRKVAVGGYTPPQTSLVREWLNTRDAERAAGQMTADARARSQEMLWNRVVGSATVLLVIAAFGEWFK